MTTSSSTDGSTTTTNRSDAAPAKPTPSGDAEPQPSPELLEFLGEFGDERGDWVDPIDLDDAAGATDEPRKPR